MRVIIIALALFISACGPKNPNVDPVAAKYATANEIVVALGTLQHAAIELNKNKLLSDDHTRVVVENVTSTLKAMGPNPIEVQALVVGTLNEIERRLDVAGKEKLAAYIRMVQIVVGLIPTITGGLDGGITADFANYNAFGTRSNCVVANPDGTHRHAHCRGAEGGVRSKSPEIHRRGRSLAARAPADFRGLKRVA